LVSKRCRKCGKAVTVDPDAKFCVCSYCDALMTVSKTLSDGKSGANRHGIKLWVVR